ncbi:MAG TPA: hypothetical protein VI818_04980 [Candidatus Thermoplasmatota archaeon]|nr:hypothetical protein [Candidatus Thermoplasmatota archaeon]
MIPRAAPVVILLLLSGCVLETDGRFPAHNQTRSTEDPDFENLVVSGTLTGGGEMVRIDAVAENQGPHPYKVSSICAPVWSDDMSGRLGPVHHREPMAYCEAFGLREFKPGERIPYAVEWDGRVWDSQAGRYEAGSPGNYTWQASVEVFKGGEQTEFETRGHVRLKFDVTLRG